MSHRDSTPSIHCSSCGAWRWLSHIQQHLHKWHHYHAGENYHWWVRRGPLSVENFNPYPLPISDTISLGRSSENVNTKQLLFLISPMDRTHDEGKHRLKVPTLRNRDTPMNGCKQIWFCQNISTVDDSAMLPRLSFEVMRASSCSSCCNGWFSVASHESCPGGPGSFVGITQKHR